MASKINNLIGVMLFLFGLSLSVAISMQAICMVLLLILAFLSAEVRHNISLSIKEPFVKVSLFIYALFILGVMWSNAPRADILHMLIKIDIFLISPIIFAIFYNAKYKFNLYYGIALGILLAVSLSIISYAFKLGFYTEDGIRYIFHGKAGHIFYGHTYQNYFAGLLSVGLLSILITQKLSKFWNAVFALIVAVCTFDIFFIMHGRGGQILYLIMLIALLLQWRVKLGLILSAVMIFLIVPMFVFFSSSVQHGISMYQSDLAKYNQGEVSTSMGARWEFHKYSLELLKSAPILGHGTGSFSSSYAGVTTKTVTNNPHNDYLWFGVELGSIGVLALLGFIGILLFESYKLRIPYKYLAIILVVTYMLACFQNSFFTDRITGEAFIVIISSLLAGNRCKKVMDLKNGNTK